MITVSHIRNPKVTHYIGRKWADYNETVWHNPFHVGKDGNRQEVILKFIEYWYAPEQAGLRRDALDFFDENAVLGCWCHPKFPECHGDIIAGYVNWRRSCQKDTLKLF